jgi:hypothetical protein
MPLAVAGCSSSKPAGIWSDEVIQLTFEKDGTGLLKTEGKVAPLRWHMLEKGRFVATSSGLGGISITGCTAKDLVKVKVNGGIENLHRGGQNGTMTVTTSPLDNFIGERTDCNP